MVPNGHESLLIASGRRARQWKEGLRRAGLDVSCVPTVGKDSEGGEFHLVVPRSQVRAGQRLVSDVLSGKSALPAGSPVTGRLLWIAAGIVLSLLGLALAALAVP